MIEIRHLTKRYGSHTAVSDLSLTVEPGKIYGFLGPNGAGKSTTMNIMTGCLSATEGSVLIDGHDIFEEPDKAKALIGYLPELPPVYPDMSPREYLTFVARAVRSEKSVDPARFDGQAQIRYGGMTAVSLSQMTNLNQVNASQRMMSQTMIRRTLNRNFRKRKSPQCFQILPTLFDARSISFHRSGLH